MDALALSMAQALLAANASPRDVDIATRRLAENLSHDLTRWLELLRDHYDGGAVLKFVRGPECRMNAFGPDDDGSMRFIWLAYATVETA